MFLELFRPCKGGLPPDGAGYIFLNFSKIKELFLQDLSSQMHVFKAWVWNFTAPGRAKPPLAVFGPPEAVQNVNELPMSTPKTEILFQTYEFELPPKACAFKAPALKLFSTSESSLGQQSGNKRCAHFDFKSRNTFPKMLILSAPKVLRLESSSFRVLFDVKLLSRATPGQQKTHKHTNTQIHKHRNIQTHKHANTQNTHTHTKVGVSTWRFGGVGVSPWRYGGRLGVSTWRFEGACPSHQLNPSSQYTHTYIYIYPVHTSNAYPLAYSYIYIYMYIYIHTHTYIYIYIFVRM